MEVAARCWGDSLYSRIQTTVPCSSCRELEWQLLGGESPPGTAWSGWSWVLCCSACPFWSRALHAYGHVDLAEPPGLFPDCAAPVQRGRMSQEQQNLGGGGPGQLSFPGRACRHSECSSVREVCVEKEVVRLPWGLTPV